MTKSQKTMRKIHKYSKQINNLSNSKDNTQFFVKNQFVPFGADFVDSEPPPTKTFYWNQKNKWFVQDEPRKIN